MSNARHVLQIFIHADRQRVWEAITDPDFTRRFFHRTAVTSTFEAGAPIRYVLPDGLDAVEGTVELAEPPARLVTTWRVLYDAAMAEEPHQPGRVAARSDGRCIDPGDRGPRRPRPQPADLGQRRNGVAMGARRAEDTAGDGRGAARGDGRGLERRPARRPGRRAAPLTSRSRRTTRRGSCSELTTSTRTRARISYGGSTRPPITGREQLGGARRTQRGRNT